MDFDPQEIKNCEVLFQEGKSTLEVQKYLMEKYSIHKSLTSNFVRLVRKRLNIYHSQKHSNVIGRVISGIQEQQQTR